MKKKKRTILIILAIIVVVIIAGVIAVNSIIKSISANMEQLEDLQISDIDLSQAADGTYTGSYKVMPVAAEVSVTIKDHKITDIKIIKHEKGKGAGAEAIPDMVVKAQSLKVDTVSGATHSSKVILKAIEEAVNKAVK